MTRRPIVTFTTDFGLRDHYVAAMKAQVLRHAPDAQLVDVTHLVPAQDVLAGSFALERAVADFPAGTIHVAVVDPGVGTARRLLVADVRDQTIICPDNGLLTWTHRRRGRVVAREVTWRPPTVSHTFHGRDVLAPVAGLLAAGRDVAALAGQVVSPLLLDVHLATPDAGTCRVIHIDHYGNATTNLPDPASSATVRVKGRSLGSVRDTYADVALGEPLALVGSAGLLEIAVRDGSARDVLDLRVGDVVTVDRSAT